MEELELILQPQLSGLKKPPTKMSQFPTMNNMEEVYEFAKRLQPISSQNQLYSLLMITQNTVLATQEKNKYVNEHNDV